MRYLLFPLIVLCTLQLTALSAVAAPAKRIVKKVKKVKPKPSSAQYGYRINYMLWQEVIDLKSATEKSQMVAQSQGIQASLVRMSVLSGKRWRWMYTGDLALGVVKGKAEGGTIADEFSNQPWYSLGGSAGIVYRTTSVSSVALAVPVAYRMITWRLSSGSTTDPDRDSSFSAGISGIYANQITPRSSLQVAFTHQQMWNATQWSIGWQSSF